MIAAYFCICKSKKHYNPKYIQQYEISEIYLWCQGIDRLFFSVYLGFLSRTFTIHRTAGEGGGYLFNSSLPLPPASQTLRHQPGDYCRELTSAHHQQPHSNRGPLVSKRKSLITKVRALASLFQEQASRLSWIRDNLLKRRLER